MSADPPTADTQTPAWQMAAGIALALLSNAFIGASVVFRKRGLIDIGAVGHDVTTGSTAYLSNKYWWAGMVLLAIGELSNFAAYAFSPAILVATLGTLSVVINAALSNVILKEKLNFLGQMGCALCILGVVMIVTNASTVETSSAIREFTWHVVQPAFICYMLAILAALLYLIFYAEPRWARQTPMVYLSMAAIGGSFLVLSAQAVGAAIVTSARNWTTENQFLCWEFYVVLVFMVGCIVFQINYLNKALALYSAAIVYPIQYVTFTGMTIISTAFLIRQFPVDNINAGASVVEGFLVLVCGVLLLYKSCSQDREKSAEEAGYNLMQRHLAGLAEGRRSGEGVVAAVVPLEMGVTEMEDGFLVSQLGEVGEKYEVGVSQQIRQPGSRGF
ncbi:hypothetical protein HDU98_012135 [Podochytrium sp. JEL0797]|nr:hypothetical protein HDU98_012135 [Podochytrium sp. JEL0797]